MQIRRDMLYCVSCTRAFGSTNVALTRVVTSYMCFELYELLFVEWLCPMNGPGGGRRGTEFFLFCAVLIELS